MPYIQAAGTTVETAIPAELLASLAKQLRDEMKGAGASGGPAIYEIPVEGAERFDVLVVWQAWRDLKSEGRTNVILDAYGERRDHVVRALGVTYEEAMQQQLLPYAIVSTVEENPMFLNKMKLAPDKEREFLDRIRKAKIDAGGIALPNGKVALRFPTRAMAEQARLALFDKLREGYWSFVQESGSGSG